MYQQKNGQEKNINKVLAKERVYNIIKVIMIAVALLLGLVYIGYQTNLTVNQIKEDNKKTREYIACLAKFFTENNRANKTIVDIESCKVQETVQAPSSKSVAVADTPTTTFSLSSFPIITPKTQPIAQVTQTPITPTTEPETTSEPTRLIETRINPITLQLEFRFEGDKFWQVQ